MTLQDATAESNRSSWREQAVARRLDPARARAEERVQRFLDAALEVMNDSASGADFTVQEVVEKSGQSLRSFYQYFGGKQELLLALFQESVLSTAEHLRVVAAQQETPVERMHSFVIEYYRICRPARRRRATKNRPTPAMAEFAQQLLTAEPTEAARAFVPLVELFEALLEEATAEGTVRSGLHLRRVSGVLLEAIMFNAFSRTIVGLSGPSDGNDDEALWELIMHGIGTDKA